MLLINKETDRKMEIRPEEFAVMFGYEIEKALDDFMKDAEYDYYCEHGRYWNEESYEDIDAKREFWDDIEHYNDYARTPWKVAAPYDDFEVVEEFL